VAYELHDLFYFFFLIELSLSHIFDRGLIELVWVYSGFFFQFYHLILNY
jgi:hypothetical protein